MNVVYERCAGLDVHKETIRACARIGKGKKICSEFAEFGTFTGELERLQASLRERKIRRVVMESTGVYWIPVWNVLERGSWRFDPVLVNPQHVKAIPGQKTDQKDSERLAEYGQYNLLRGSFVPEPEFRELRDLTRRRTQLQGERNRILNRIGRLLETGNIKLGSVVSDLAGKTGWLILKSLAGGTRDPEDLAQLAQGSLQEKTAELERSLRGYVSEHFRWMLRQLLDDLSQADRKLTDLQARTRAKMERHGDLIRRLCTIPGVGETTAWTLIAELGIDMSRFPTAGHAASWSGVCPGQNESAGKRLSGRTKKGDRYLRRGLIQSGWAASKKKNCYLSTLFFRVASRRGLKRAALAVAHRILQIAFLVIRDGVEYRELGGDFHDQLHPERTAARLAKRLERIGFEVKLSRVSASAAVPFGTERWHGPRKPRRRSLGRAATPDECKKCAAWKIPCIHVRNQPTKPDAPEPDFSVVCSGFFFEGIGVRGIA